MDIISPIPEGVAHVAGPSGSPLSSLLKMVTDNSGLFADDSPDGWLGIAMSGLAGVATALAVAIVLSVYFRSGYRSTRDIFKHGLAAAAVLALLAFAATDMRHAALAYLGINPSNPAVEFEIRLPKAAALTVANSQIELHTDRNQTLAQVQAALGSDDDGRSIIRGSLPLDFRPTDRVVILTLPGQPQCQFKLRLAASPSRSDQFGPWHLADRLASADKGEETPNEQNDAFALTYRVL